ncbi:death-associated protein kinase 3-like [Phascolarctos cinereus]
MQGMLKNASPCSALCNSLPLCAQLILWFFCPNAHQLKGEAKAPEHKKTEPPQVKTKRLREYTMKCHSSMPRNNTYVNFERFARVVEDVAEAEHGCSELASAHDSLQDDVEALVSIYNEKEAWYREESENTRYSLSQLKYEYRKVEAMKKTLQEDIRTVASDLGSVAGKYAQLGAQYESLRQELSEDLKWIQELMSDFQQESGSEGSLGSVFKRDANESLMELLNRSCSEDFLAGLKLRVTESSQ